MSCPRCNAPDVEMMTRSATGAWEVYLCGKCFYCWRTTEAPQFKQHDLCDSKFLLDAEKIARFTDLPPVPPRKGK